MPRRSPVVMLQMAVTGCAATAVDVLTLFALVALPRMPAGVAAAGGCLAGGTCNFVLLRTWVFGRDGDWLRQLALYVVTVVLAGALLCGGIVEVAVRLGLALLAAKLVAAVVTLVAWNYPVSARFVFARQEQERP